MIVLDCEQRSPEWYAARLGIPTASEFGSIITPAKGQLAAAHDAYINRLIDEAARPGVDRSWSGNRHTERGRDLEPEARNAYAFLRGVTPREVGMVLNDERTAACSPDSLVDDGGLEVKCPDGPTHVAWLRAGKLPDDHKAQVHGCMVITGAPWWDFLSYCDGYRPLLLRVVRDDFTAKLATLLDGFVEKLAIERAKVLGDA